MKIRQNFVVIFIILIVLWFYRVLFSFTPLVSGDWIYYFQNSIKSIVPLSAWDITHNGLGQSTLGTLWIESYFTTTVKSVLFIPWPLYERIFWFFPSVIFSFVSMWLLAAKVVKDKTYSLVASLVYTTNTYILLVIGGGQAGVALAYGLIPFVFLSYKLVQEALEKQKKTFLWSIVFSLAISAVTIVDIRVSYLAIGGVCLWFAVDLVNGTANFFRKVTYSFIIPFCITALLNAYWILPIVVSRYNPVSSLSAAYTSLASVSFFSFAKFENAISFIHPNWPENIFGRVHFLRPEFLIIPLLAFGSLLFISKFKNKNTESGIDGTIVFFALLALVGIFLSKGTNDPFGFIYLFFFSHIPGFVMFRDATKWYMLVSISYSILIAYFLLSISRSKFFSFVKPREIIIILFVVLWCFITRDAFLGRLNGLYNAQGIPQEYEKLEQFLSNKNDYYKTLWIPVSHRVSASSTIHPVVMGNDFFKNKPLVYQLKKLKDPTMKNVLEDSNILYVIIPADTTGSIFVDDGKYNPKLYASTLREARSISYLKEVKDFGNIAVFSVPNFKKRFWSTTPNLITSFKSLSIVEHKVNIHNAKKGDVVIFADTYDRGWIARGDNFAIESKPFDNRLNSFQLPKSGSYILDVYYRPQDSVNIGLIISGATLAVIVYLIFKMRKV